MKYAVINGLVYILPVSVYDELERSHNVLYECYNDEYAKEFNEVVKRIEEEYEPITKWYDSFATLEVESGKTPLPF